MKRSILHFSFLFAIGLAPCNSATNKQEEKDKEIKIESISKSKSQEGKSTKSNETEIDCIRGKAKPIIKKAIYPHSTFVMQPDSLTAYETLTFYNKDKLTIHNYGCEYYTLTFRFETTRFQKKTNDLLFLFWESVTLMSEIKDGIDTPFDIKKGLDNLENT